MVHSDPRLLGRTQYSPIFPMNHFQQQAECGTCHNKPRLRSQDVGRAMMHPARETVCGYETVWWLQHASTQLLDINITKLHRYDWHSARLQLLATLWPPQVLICSLWDFQTWLIAMENPPFTDNFPIEMSMFNGFPS